MDNKDFEHYSRLMDTYAQKDAAIDLLLMEVRYWDSLSWYEHAKLALKKLFVRRKRHV